MKQIIKKTVIVMLTAFSVFGVVGGSLIGSGEANIAQAATTAAKNTKIIKIEGKNTVVPAKGNKWVNVNGFYHFVKDGVLVKGWRHLTPADGEKTSHYSYFDKDTGRIYTGWKNLGKKEGEKTSHWSYFGPNGWLRTGWQVMGGSTSNPDGKNPQHWSYFGPDGWLRTGWQKMGKGTSNPDGKAPQHWSYFGPNGWLRIGMQSMGTNYNPDGKNANHLSYFGTNGWLMTSGKVTMLGITYKADSRGWLKEDDGRCLDKNHSWKDESTYVDQSYTYNSYEKYYVVLGLKVDKDTTKYRPGNQNGHIIFGDNPDLKEIKKFKTEKEAKNYLKKNQGECIEKYIKKNTSDPVQAEYYRLVIKEALRSETLPANYSGGGITPKGVYAIKVKEKNEPVKKTYTEKVCNRSYKCTKCGMISKYKF